MSTGFVVAVVSVGVGVTADDSVGSTVSFLQATDKAIAKINRVSFFIIIQR